MVVNILKYRSINLIMFNCCACSELLDTIKIVIQNSMRLIKNVEFGSWVDIEIECDLH